MLKENIETVIDILILNGKLSVEKIIEETAIEGAIVNHSLNVLKVLDLIKKDKEKYFLIENISAIHLAKSAQLGIDLLSFNFFNITEEEKNIALDLATNVEKVKQLEINKRKPLIQKRVYFNKSDEVTDNLILLLEASNLTLYNYLEKLSEKDEYLKILLEMHEQTEKSLSSYLDYLK